MKESNNNVCKFPSAQQKERDLIILNFVRETNFDNPRLMLRSDFRLHIVAGGEGYLSTLRSKKPLEVGDMFLTYPSTNYSITSKNGLELYYVTFLGLNGYDIIERTELYRNTLLKGKNDMLSFWKEQFEFTESGNIDLIAECVLLYSFGHLCISSPKTELGKKENTVLQIKKTLDDRFTDPELELNKICQENYYNPKYISTAFKKVVGMTFSAYLLQLRVNNASNLIENGLTSVKQIALCSGFSDTNYFTRVFKKYCGMTPIEAIRQSKKNQ